MAILLPELIDFQLHWLSCIKIMWCDPWQIETITGPNCSQSDKDCGQCVGRHLAL